MSNTARFSVLKQAFQDDGFDIHDFSGDPKYQNWVQPEGFLEYQRNMGIMAVSRTAVVGQEVYPDKEKGYKKVFYVEGDAKQMGFLHGLMAEPEVAVMTTEYVKNVVPDFIGIKIDKDSKLIAHIQEIFVELMGEATAKMIPDIPPYLIDEMEGIIEGCRAVNPGTKVEMDDLHVLNMGIDFLLSHIYTGKIFKKKKSRIPATLLKVPIMCNAVSLSGSVVEAGKHYFGRDFMFPTAKVFQDVACLMIYNPRDENGNAPPDKISMIAQTAPGFVGSMSAMNSHGVAMGVDMLPSSHCNPEQPGLNSLLMVRHCIQTAENIDRVAQTVIDSPRGVSWIYPVADGQSEKTCFIEAAERTEDNTFDYYKEVPKHYRKRLPEVSFFEQMRQQHNIDGPKKGLMIRWGGYNYPIEFIQNFNRNLWKAYNWDFIPKLIGELKDLAGLIWDVFRIIIGDSTAKKGIIWKALKEIRDLLRRVPYKEEYFDKFGFIAESKKDKKCPGPYYFAPQRETFGEVAIVGNHYITPEMRMTGMSRWIGTLEGNRMNEFQWRYDKMNQIIQTLIRDGETINASSARNIIDFLRPVDNPDETCREFYNPDFMITNPGTIQVGGSVSLFELKNKWMTSHFGYYGDEWIDIHFPKYLV